MGYQTSSYFITKAPQHDWESVGLPHMWKAWLSLSKYNRLYSFEWGSHTKMDIFWSLEAIKLPRRTWSYFLFWSYISLGHETVLDWCFFFIFYSDLYCSNRPMVVKELRKKEQYHKRYQNICKVSRKS